MEKTVECHDLWKRQLNVMIRIVQYHDREGWRSKKKVAES